MMSKTVGMIAVYAGRRYLGEVVQLSNSQFESLDHRGRSLGVFPYRIDAEQKILHAGGEQ